MADKRLNLNRTISFTLRWIITGRVFRRLIALCFVLSLAGASVMAYEPILSALEQKPDPQISQEQQRISDARVSLTEIIKDATLLLSTIPPDVPLVNEKALLQKSVDHAIDVRDTATSSKDITAAADTLSAGLSDLQQKYTAWSEAQALAATNAAEAARVAAEQQATQDAEAARLAAEEQAAQPGQPAPNLPAPQPVPQAPAPIPAPQPAPQPGGGGERQTKSASFTCSTTATITFTAAGGGTVSLSVSGAGSGSNSGSGSTSVTVSGGSGTYTATATGDGSVSVSGSATGSCS